MKIISKTTQFQIEEKTAVAIGKFDGIHKGHKMLLTEILNKRKEGLKSCVFTFDPSPEVLFGKRKSGELTTIEEKRRIFEEMGIDILIEFPLTWESAAILPKDFVTDILVGQMNAAFVAAGDDLSFGDKGKGDAKLLMDMSASYGYVVKTICKVCIEDGRELSSTMIREELEKGNMEKVEQCMGSPYQISGTIVHGNRIGRTIGFPTINIHPGAEKLLPPYGVYFSKVRIGDKEYQGLSNLGCKPTVSAGNMCGLETYLYDFEGDLYGENATVMLYHFSRPELRFENLNALKAQIREDMLVGEKYWKK